jgi:hypothetical protein
MGSEPTFGPDLWKAAAKLGKGRAGMDAAVPVSWACVLAAVMDPFISVLFCVIMA